MALQSSGCASARRSWRVHQRPGGWPGNATALYADNADRLDLSWTQKPKPCDRSRCHNLTTLVDLGVNDEGLTLLTALTALTHLAS
jgi:hypothetical protein